MLHGLPETKIFKKDLKSSYRQGHLKNLDYSFFKSILKSIGSMHYQLNIKPPL